KYIREYIRLADQKAAFIFTVSAALLAFLFNKNAFEYWLKVPKNWTLVDLFSFLGMAGLAIAAFCSIYVVIPRLKGSQKGYIYWNSIANFDSSIDYANALSILGQEDLARAISEHCFELSKICQAKYKTLNLSFRAAVLGIIFTVLFVLSI
ncbi:MAG: Pycsar system effector family protein, partial [Pseudomonadota bacterium]